MSPDGRPGPAADPVARRFEHRVDALAVQPPGAHLFAHHPLGLGGAERGTVRTGLTQRLVNVGGTEDPHRQRDGVATQPVRVAGPVKPFMVQRRAAPDLGQ